MTYFSATPVLALVLLAGGLGACSGRSEEQIEVLSEPGYQTYTLFSDQYNDSRDLIIRLPASYKADDHYRYPAIYLMDGGLDQDFYSALGALHSNESGKITRQMILIGIPSVDRIAEYTPPSTNPRYDEFFETRGGAETHIKYLENDVIPWVEANFKTDEKILAGQSLGGLFTLYNLHNSDLKFDHYFAISPSLWWDNERIFDTPPNSLRSTVIVALGNEQGLMRTNALKYISQAAENGIGDRVFFYDYSASEDHESVYLTAFQDALRTIALRPKRAGPSQRAFFAFADGVYPKLSEAAEESLKIPCNKFSAIRTTYHALAADPLAWNMVCILAKPGTAPSEP